MLSPKHVAVILFLTSSPVWFSTAWCSSQSASRGQLTAGLELFHWQEFDTNSPLRLLSEQGARMTLQTGWNDVFHDTRFRGININAHLYSGAINYDGQTQSTIDPTKNGIFVASTSRYKGLGLELEKLSPLKNNDHAAMMLALGGDIWRRSIEQSTDAQGNPVSGASEDYRVVHSRLGLQWMTRGAFGDARLRLGIRYPLWIDEHTADITLRPEPAVSLFASYRLSLADKYNTIIDIYYDSLRLKPSPVVIDQYGDPWLQPESKQDNVGLMIGFPF